MLDVGSGSGYLSHVLAELVKPNGVVFGIEHIQPLVDLSIRNARKSAVGRELLESGLMNFIKGDGRLGWADGAPYDAIHVGAAAREIHPQLLEQLKAPGRSVQSSIADGNSHVHLECLSQCKKDMSSTSM